MKVQSAKSQSGFSLIELMVVVGIIGVLAMLAIPRFQQFQAKARMAEARSMLTHLYTLEEAYHLDTNLYQNMPAYGRLATGTNNCSSRPAEAVTIGFEISPCDQNSTTSPRFGYSVAGATRVAYTASAVTGAAANNLVCPSPTAPVLTFTINQDKLLNGPSSCN